MLQVINLVGYENRKYNIQKAQTSISSHLPLKYKRYFWNDPKPIYCTLALINIFEYNTFLKLTEISAKHKHFNYLIVA